MRIKTPAEWELARRDVLKYLGVGAACLPLLSAGRAKGATAATRKMIIIHTSEGYRQQYWKPSAGTVYYHLFVPGVGGTDDRAIGSHLS